MILKLQLLIIRISLTFLYWKIHIQKMLLRGMITYKRISWIIILLLDINATGVMVWAMQVSCSSVHQWNSLWPYESTSRDRGMKRIYNFILHLCSLLNIFLFQHRLDLCVQRAKPWLAPLQSYPPVNTHLQFSFRCFVHTRESFSLFLTGAMFSLLLVTHPLLSRIICHTVLGCMKKVATFPRKVMVYE